MKKSVKKTIIAILAIVSLILLVAEGKDVVSNILIKGIALITGTSTAYLWRAWRMSADRRISRFIDEE